MTLVNIDLKNAGYEAGPDDRVVFYSPANRNEQGTIISTAEASVPLVDGQASKELAPGPVVVQILAQGVADTRPKSGYVPDEGPVSLWDVVLDWTPALVDQGIIAILTAVETALSRIADAAEDILSAPGLVPERRVVENLFDSDQTVPGALSPSGAIVDHQSNRTSHHMPVMGTMQYSSYYALLHRIAFFDENKATISVSEWLDGGVHHVLTTPEEARFARATLTFSSVTPQTMIFNIGTELAGDTPFPLDSGFWDDRELPPMPDISDIDADGLVPERKTIDNLWDQDASTLGTMTQSGAVSEHHFNRVSPYIPVIPGETYSASVTDPALIRLVFFTAEETAILSTDRSLAGGVRRFIAPDNAAFARVGLSPASGRPYTVVFNAGEVLYDPASPDIQQPSGFWDDRELPPTRPHFAPYDIYTYDPPIADIAGLMEHYEAPVIPDAPELATITPDVVYGWWDDLMAAHPDYITREYLGTACDDVTPMYKYTLKPPSVPTTVTGETTHEQEHPILLMITGVHAYEQGGIYHTYLLAEQVATAWDTHPGLRALRWGFEIVVIPLGNPTGLMNTPHTRVNGRGVDIGRNFPTGWIFRDGDTPSGPNALSEPEAQHIDAVMRQVAPRTVFGVSYHNFGSTTTNPWCMIWVAPTTNFIRTLGKSLVSRMSVQWRKAHTWITDSSLFFGFVDHGERPGGGEGAHFPALGIPGAVFETSLINRLGAPEPTYSSRAMTLGLEAFVNYVLMGAYEGLRIQEIEMQQKPA